MHHTLRPHVWSRVKEPMMAKGLLQSRRPASSAGIFASGVKLPAGQPVFVSGQVIRDAAGEIVGQGAIRAQTRQTPGNLRAVVEAAGPTLSAIVKVTVFESDVSHLSASHEGCDRCCEGAYPASPLADFKSLVSRDRLDDTEAIAVAPT
jgi:2-iminobutanoate/2-iminopropanoate deaminase